MLINAEEINRVLTLTETRKINSGKKMFEQDRVKIIDVNIKNDNNFVIKSLVYDSKGENQFVCIIKENNNIDLKCDCKEYSANYATCSHSIAAIFDIYVNPEKYENFVKTGNEIGIINSHDYKRLPENINKNTIYSSICNILNESNLELLYDFIKDIIKKRAYNTYITASAKFLFNSKIKVFEYDINNPKINFCVFKEGDDIVIKSNIIDYNFFILKNKLMFLEDDNLYSCSDEFTFNMLPYIIFINYNKRDVIAIHEEKFRTLYERVLGNILNYVNIIDDENILSNYSIAEFKTEVYLDIDNNKNIVATLYLGYDKFKVNPLSKIEVENIKRNEFLELNVIRYLVNLNFKVDNKKEIFFIDSDDYKFEFLKEGIKKLTSKYNVFATEKIRKRQILKTHKNSIGVKVNNNLIELDINNLKYSSLEISEILKAYKLNKKYYKLKNDDYLNLEDKNVKALYGLLNEAGITSADIKLGKIVLPKYKAMYLDSIFRNNEYIDIDFSQKFKDIVDKVYNFKKQEYKIPQKLNASLREYQIDGYNWLKTLQEFNFGGILADDMGLGKTIQIIAILLDAKSKAYGTSLVVCTTSLYFNWQKELEKFAPNLKTLVIYGSQNNREDLISKINDYDVIITSYDLIKRDIEKYSKYEFNYIVADEAQYIKNTNTQNSMAIKKINAKNRVALTGTPMENNLSELWSIFDFIMPGYLYSYSKFKEVYEKKVVFENSKEAHDKLIKLVSPFILRRKKQDVLDDLPNKTETIMYSNLTEEQRELYDIFLDDTKRKIAEYRESKGISQARIEILSLITRLRQICIHPKMFVENYTGGSAKQEQMIELLKDAICSGHKILIFSSFTSMFEILEERLNEEKINYFELTGKTKKTERLELVQKFNNLENVRVFLVSLKAGGIGLNLIGADIVMHIDPWWNVAKENQATDRTYRIGQKKNIQVFKFIAKDSIEEKILKMQEDKSYLIDKIIKTDKDIKFKFDLEEILKIL